MAKKKKTPPPPLAEAEHFDFLTCTAHFISPLLRRTIPREFASGFGLGERGRGPVAAGFIPEGFAFSVPASPMEGILQSDATWGRGATIRVCFMDGRTAMKERVEVYANQWAEAADLTFEFGATRSSSDIRITFNGTGFS